MSYVRTYVVYNNHLAVAGPDDEEEINGLDHSPSCRAPNACGFHIGDRDVELVEGVLEALVRGPILKLTRCMGAVRHLMACARRRRRRTRRVPDVDEARVMLKKSLSITDGGGAPRGMQAAASVVNLKYMKMELLAVLRHLEVRWQLFNEAMTKWCDLEAMLAICTENVTWSGGSGVVIKGKDSPLLSQNLGSLLNRNLSHNVVIERLTRLSPKVLPDMSLDKDGNCIELEDSELRKASATLDKLLGSRKHSVYNEECWNQSQGPYMVLEKGWYTLQNPQGDIVEQGSRTVLWKQHNSTWYIRACVITPMREQF